MRCDNSIRTRDEKKQPSNPRPALPARLPGPRARRWKNNSRACGQPAKRQRAQRQSENVKTSQARRHVFAPAHSLSMGVRPPAASAEKFRVHQRRREGGWECGAAAAGTAAAAAGGGGGATSVQRVAGTERPSASLAADPAHTERRARGATPVRELLTQLLISTACACMGILCSHRLTAGCCPHAHAGHRRGARPEGGHRSGAEGDRVEKRIDRAV